ncbi:basic blue protein [Brachypodium distachyon]|uniref:Plantacyanin n=1 Tax=Brachypodium distachyon TaxID=15368 RepID=I1HZB2_BRADI|nr:basic blue protein [Brachypodium distachyon]KQJ94278.1 hypothetical protein BRADI_3g09630v3 [Brachypodium distachyon]|eukprot:XP_003571173.1 basic blue protein [Brachypodium distachyon]
MARISIGTMVLGLLIAICCTATIAHSKEWTVGDAKGWSFRVAGWESGLAIHTGDTLVFKYNPKEHNVVQVDEKSYNACSVSGRLSGDYNSGNDHIRVGRGKSFFICSFAGHCEQGMKIAITPE